MGDPVGEILAAYGVHDEWGALPWTGVANRIYATRDFVLRIATDHPDAVPDARTESVAAPVARAAGVPVPRLVAFDDSRRLVDRPFSIWERVHGETLGILAPAPQAVPDTWREVGRQLALLHTNVRECPDPDDWLDRPERASDFRVMLAALRERRRLSTEDAAEIEDRVRVLLPRLATAPTRCFLHNDMHPMNVMCSADGTLLAILDWGDAGWGDPTLEFAQVPPRAVPFMLEGYRAEAPDLLGDTPGYGIVWDQLAAALEDWDPASSRERLDDLRWLAGVLVT